MAPIIIGLAARAGSFAVIDSTVDGVCVWRLLVEKTAVWSLVW